MAGPGHPLLRVEDGEVGLGSGRREDQPAFRPLASGRALRHQPATQLGGIAHGGGKSRGGHHRRDASQTREVERQEVAALGGDDRVQLVEHHAAQVGEQMRRVGRGEQQGDLLGRRQQDVGRVDALPLALVHGGVAGARLDADRQAHVGDGMPEVALHVDGERLQRRDVESVEARPVGGPRQIDKRGQEAGECLAGAGWRDKQRALARLSGGEQIELVAARCPGTRSEPRVKALRQEGGRQEGGESGRVHHADLSSSGLMRPALPEAT